ncbi:MAG: gp16 family protein [Halothiobacillus sp.]
MNDRRNMLAKIHIAKKDLRLDDDTYRAILARHGTSSEMPSSRDLTIAQMDAVLREFTGFGWQPKQPKAGRKPKPAACREVLMGKIEALLADKARRQGQVVSWNYAHAIARRVCKVDLLDFCDTTMLGKVIAALTYSAHREIAAIEGKQ